MENEPLIAPDLVLLLLATSTRWEQATNRINGITRLEKLLFLVDKECNYGDALDKTFDFVPYHYGPYSKEVYEAVELLEEAGLIEEQRNFTDSELDRAEELLYSGMATEISYERQFILTDDGKSIARYLFRNRPQLEAEIRRIKDTYAGLPLQTLIYYVYTKYPDYAVRSVIRDKIVHSD